MLLLPPALVLTEKPLPDGFGLHESSQRVRTKDAHMRAAALEATEVAPRSRLAVRTGGGRLGMSHVCGACE